MEITREETESKGKLIAKDGENEMGELSFSIANEGQLIIANHTGVDAKYKGEGVGNSLFLEMVEMARREKRNIMPLCPFIRSMFEKKKDNWDVIRHGSL